MSYADTMMLHAERMALMNGTPPTPATEEREAVARAIADANGSPHVEDWRLDADAALSALAPIRAAEILAAEANVTARIVDWLREKAMAAWMRKTQTTIDPMTYLSDAIERNEHGAGK